MTSTYIYGTDHRTSGGGDLGKNEQTMFQILWTFYNTKQVGTRVKTENTGLMCGYNFTPLSLIDTSCTCVATI